MASDRQQTGFIWGKGILDHAHIEHYAKAMRSDDIRKEEYWYQSVFHGPEHSKRLSQEVFQKKIRNNVTNKVEVETLVSTTNSDVVNDILAEERRKEVMYSRVVDDQKVVNVAEYLPDTKVGFTVILKELSDKCNRDEVKVLAFFVCSEGLDKILTDVDGFYHSEDKLSKAIIGIWEGNVSNINALNKFVGTRARADKARWSLTQMIKKEYPELLTGRK